MFETITGAISSAAGIANSISSIGSAIGGLFGGSSAKKQNREAKKAADLAYRRSYNMAQDSMRFSALQAKTQQDFQEYMSNTSHVREVADLKAAGLNPILSGTGGMGASTAQGAAARGEMGSASAQPVVNEGASALEQARTAAEIANLNENRKLTQAQTLKVAAETATEMERPANIKTDTSVKAATVKATEGLSELNWQSSYLKQAERKLTEVQKLLADYDLDKLKPSQAHEIQSRINILREEYKTAHRIGEMNDTDYAKAMGYIKLFTDSLPIKAR